MVAWTLLLLVLASLNAAAAVPCDGPYKTLSSDCRGLLVDANTVCVVLDQRVPQPSPCSTTTGQSNCAAATGLPCDVLMYRIDYQGANARFRIAFSSNGSVTRPTQRDRRLVSMETASSPTPQPPSTAPPTTTPPMTIPPRVDFTTMPPQTPPPREDFTDPPATTPPHTLPPPRVDFNDPPTTTSPHTPPPRVDFTTPPPTMPTTMPPRVDITIPATTMPPRVDFSTPPPTGTAPPRVDFTPFPVLRASPAPNDLPPRVDFTANPPTTTPPTNNSPTIASPILPTPTIPPGTVVPGPMTAPPVAPGPSSTPVSTATPTNPSNGTNPPVVNDKSAESNDFVQAIGQLRLDPTITDLGFYGGTNAYGTRGKTVQLWIDSQVLAQSPNVTSFWVANCNISAQFVTGGILSGLPRGLTDLSFQNTLMQTEPMDLSALQNLKTLQMGQNYLKTITNKIWLEKLTMLDLSENDLTSFEPGLPALESLFLNKNNFTTIPNVVYSMTKLQELQLVDNPLVAIVVSTTQYDFLAKLRFKINQPPIPPPPPVIYVTKNDTQSVTVPKDAGLSARVLVSEGDGLNLNVTDADLNNTVAKPVGNLTDLQGVPVWKLSDADYAVFQTQQQVISTSTVVINGTKVQSYLAMAASVAAAAITTSPTTMKPIDEKTASPSDAEHRSSDGKSHNKVLVVSLIIAAVVIALVAVVLFVHGKQRNNKSTGSTEATVTSPRDPIIQPPYQGITYRTNSTDNSSYHEVFTSRRIRVTDLHDVRPIGSGTTSIIWLVQFRNSRFLASKRLLQSSLTNQRMTEFVNEIIIAADLDHPRIICLIGVAWTNRTDLQALYEYMPNGDLEAQLKMASPQTLVWANAKLRIVIEIVEALVYTHSFNPPLLHRDLRARHVLLDEGMTPKLSKFGSARFASEQNTMTTDGIGSSRWLAPEILLGNTDYNVASDIYAFGVLLCELDTHQMPYEDVRNVDGAIMAETALMELVARGELRPRVSRTCPPQIRDMAAQCLAQNPHERPPAVRIAYELRLLTRAWS